MMRAIILFALLSLQAIAQDIPWDGKYQLKISDFQSSASQIGNTNVYSLQTFSGVDFTFHMSKIKFMMTKNFNDKVNNNFKRSIAAMVAPDAIVAGHLLKFAQFEFDSAELYARKFRKKIFEEKGTFSDVSFFRPFYDQFQKEYSASIANAAKQTDLGRDSAKLSALHEIVLKEIETLDKFCRECKPD